ncbi:hypothetical protein FQA39_LY10339 [Lamprigera yunnana]|nr:hypothetical protein FQA39_LY10339 [Lamprigera yunnana]
MSKSARTVATNTNTFKCAANCAKKDLGLKERRVNHIKLSDSTDLKEIYSFGKKIGQGGFGTVISILDKRNDKNWALKMVSKAAVGERIDTIYREINILKMVNHPHIIYLEKVFESSKEIYLVLELCYGTLSAMYSRRKPFAEDDTKKVIRDLASAVSYLHKNDIVHRDLKLENILIAKNPDDEHDQLYIKVTDFGLSIVKKGNGYENMLHDCCGTLVYMAPEIITSRSYSQQCDVWAIGVIMYMLLSGSLPFYSDQEPELTATICEEEPSYARFAASPEAIDLMTKLLNKNPALRATASEVSRHPWIIGRQIKESDISGNVLDMMKLWKTEMMLPTGDECDWVSHAKAYGKKTSDEREKEGTTSTNINRQSMRDTVKSDKAGARKTSDGICGQVTFVRSKRAKDPRCEKK